MQFERSRLIDSNGQLYLVGRDHAGWFTIAAVERAPDGDLHGREDHPEVSFSPGTAMNIATFIQEVMA